MCVGFLATVLVPAATRVAGKKLVLGWPPLCRHTFSAEPLRPNPLPPSLQVKETAKIWGENDVAITATCIRVPVMRAHAESINLEFENDISGAQLLCCRSLSCACCWPAQLKCCEAGGGPQGGAAGGSVQSGSLST